MSQTTIFNAAPTGPRMSLEYSQSWGVTAHGFSCGSGKQALIVGCFSDTEGGDEAAQENAKFIAQMLNLREETSLTAEQIRTMLMASAKMSAAIQAAFDCEMVPNSSAKDGGASRYSSQVLAADQLREALNFANYAKG